ncbi:gamma-glutamylcyclotransferase family protein [Vibrio sp. RC27]
MTNLVFVYGTLRRGESNHYLLEHSEFLGKVQTQPLFSLYDLGEYPGAIEGDAAIIGEVYQVNETTLEALDRLEEVPIEYRRDTLQTSLGQAWIYLYQDERQLEQLIPSGDWCTREHQE